MARETDRSMDWSVGCILLMVLTLTISMIPGDSRKWCVARAADAVALLGPVQHKHTDRSTVLLLSQQPNDRFAVASTLEPRGYSVRVVRSAGAAIDELARKDNQIAVVVADESVPGARETLMAARKLCPEACPILLKGRREPTQVATILFDALDRHLTPSQARGLQQQALLRGAPAAR